jgi:hypothetical protein
VFCRPGPLFKGIDVSNEEIDTLAQGFVLPGSSFANDDSASMTVFNASTEACFGSAPPCNLQQTSLLRRQPLLPDHIYRGSPFYLGHTCLDEACLPTILFEYLLGTCSQVLWVKKRQHKILKVKLFCSSKHYFSWDIMIFRRRSWRTSLHHLLGGCPCVATWVKI